MSKPASKPKSAKPLYPWPTDDLGSYGDSKSVQRKINGWIQAADVWKGLRDDLPGLWEKLAQIPEDADETPVQKWTAAYASRSRPPPFFAFDPLTGVLSHGGKTIKAFVRGTPQEHESFRGDLVFDGKQATFLLPPASVSVKGSASGDGKRDAPGMFAARATNGYEPVTVVAVEVGTPPNTHKVPAVPNLHKVVNDLCYQVGEAIGFPGDKDAIERLGFALHVWHTLVNLNIARALFYHGVGDLVNVDNIFDMLGKSKKKLPFIEDDDGNTVFPDTIPEEQKTLYLPKPLFGFRDYADPPINMAAFKRWCDVVDTFGGDVSAVDPQLLPGEFRAWSTPEVCYNNRDVIAVAAKLKFAKGPVPVPYWHLARDPESGNVEHVRSTMSHHEFVAAFPFGRDVPAFAGVSATGFGVTLTGSHFSPKVALDAVFFLDKARNDGGGRGLEPIAETMSENAVGALRTKARTLALTYEQGGDEDEEDREHKRPRIPDGTQDVD